MNQITGTIQNIFSDRPLQEDEYRNESDNLIHCAKCKTPFPFQEQPHGAAWVFYIWRSG